MESKSIKRKSAGNGASARGEGKQEARKAKKKEVSEDDALEDEEQVEFDFGDPSESDFHIIKSLVQRYLDAEDLDSSALADLIIDEAQVSSVIRCADDCIGVAAVLPLSVFRDKLPVEQVLKFWQKRAKGSKEVQQDLAAALEGSKTAILLSERVLNAPPELAAPLVAGLASEIKALSAEKAAPERVHARFDLLLHCATAYVDSGAGAHDLGAVPLSTAAVTTGTAGDVVFIRPEDEFMHNHAKWSHRWDMPESGQYSKHSKKIRVLMAISKKGFNQALKEMSAMFQHDLSQHGL